jgi:hypothetical protein
MMRVRISRFFQYCHVILLLVILSVPGRLVRYSYTTKIHDGARTDGPGTYSQAIAARLIQIKRAHRGGRHSRS